MEFNASKCKVLHLGNKNKQFSDTMGGHALGGQILEVTNCEKDIGVLISNDLKHSLQCASAAQKANQTLKNFKTFYYLRKVQ